MFEQILLPLDGSDAARNAVPYALELAQRYNSALNIISVVAVRPSESREVIFKKFEDGSQPVVDDVTTRAAQTDVHTVAVSVIAGSPIHAIEQYATDHEIDCIVMGTHGRTGLEHALHGSITEEIVRTAEVPVVTIPLRTQTERDQETMTTLTEYPDK